MDISNTIGRRHPLVQTGIAAATLLAGAVVYLQGMKDLAAWLWLLGTSLVLIEVLVDTGMALWHKELGLDLIALVSIGGALALHEYLTAAVIALMFASGRALERFAEERARHEMSALLSKAPRFANRYEGNNVTRVALDAIRPNDRILVQAGETVPVDGHLLSAVAVVDESSLTGEPLPVSYEAGKFLESGIVNAGNAFDMQAIHAAKDSTFTQIIRLVEAAQSTKAPAARLADRYALLFVPLSLGIAGIAWLLTGDPNRALAVIVVATPCPLILGVPVAIVCAMSQCAERGVLIKHGGALERMSQAKILFFDKTGTLTGGKARLIDITSAPSIDQTEMLRLAASVEQMSGHVIAQAVVAAARERGLKLMLPENVQEAPGAGLVGRVDGKTVRVGGYDFAIGNMDTPAWAAAAAARIGYEGASGVYIAVDGALYGVLQMADEIRLETPRAMRLLRAVGVERIMMLTGDRHDVATTIGNSLGVDAVLAEQTPASKLKAIADAHANGIVMMVGDGINDAPALAAADVGVAMGARGAAAAAESAQIVLLVDRLDRLAVAIRIAQQARRIAIECVTAGMGLSMIAMLVAAFGYLPPVAGAVLQEVIDVAVILNALRVLRVGKAIEGERMPVDEVARLKQEHVRLLPIMDRLGKLADRVGDLPAPVVRQELVALNEALRHDLLPHEVSDDTELYPSVARLIGGDDPMAVLSSTHREIYRLSRAIDRLAANTHNIGTGDGVEVELRRTLYALDTVVRLHFAQEEEIFHNVSS